MPLRVLRDVHQQCRQSCRQSFSSHRPHSLQVFTREGKNPPGGVSECRPQLQKNVFRLGISFHTVKFHVASILAKLDAESRTEAVTHAARLGLVML